MSPINMLSLLCLIVTGTICAWGIFSDNFDDNLIQRAGLSIMCIGIGARIWERVTQDVPEPPLALLWSQVGIALYAIGTATRLWLQARQQPDRRRGPGRRGWLYPAKK